MPFTAEQFFRVFEKYNDAVFPIQIFLILTAVAAVVLARKPRGFSGSVVTGLLAFLWVWSGVVYHWTFFIEINPAAYVFGALFVVQGCLLIYQGILKSHLKFRFEPNSYGIIGAAFVAYALVIYPVIGSVLGHAFPASPSFGAPCPIVIFTFGLLMWAERLAWPLLVIPVLWAFISLSAAVSFGVIEDFGLLIAAAIGAAFIIRRELLDERRLFHRG